MGAGIKPQTGMQSAGRTQTAEIPAGARTLTGLPFGPRPHASSFHDGPEPPHPSPPVSDLSLARLESSHLPNQYAMVNDRINRMEPEQYPPSPALCRNENPPYPRLIGTDYQKFILKVES